MENSNLCKFSTNYSIIYLCCYCLKSWIEIGEVYLRSSSNPLISTVFIHTTRQGTSSLWTRFHFSLQPMHLSDQRCSVVVCSYLYGSHTQGPQINHSPTVQGFMQLQREDGTSSFPPWICSGVQRPVGWQDAQETGHFRETGPLQGRCNKWMLIREIFSCG